MVIDSSSHTALSSETRVPILIETVLIIPGLCCEPVYDVFF